MKVTYLRNLFKCGLSNLCLYKCIQNQTKWVLFFVLKGKCNLIVNKNTFKNLDALKTLQLQVFYIFKVRNARQIYNPKLIWFMYFTTEYNICHTLPFLLKKSFMCTFITLHATLMLQFLLMTKLLVDLINSKAFVL